VVRLRSRTGDEGTALAAPAQGDRAADLKHPERFPNGVATHGELLSKNALWRETISGPELTCLDQSANLGR
jgi:hypothetical protein